MLGELRRSTRVTWASSPFPTSTACGRVAQTGAASPDEKLKKAESDLELLRGGLPQPVTGSRDRTDPNAEASETGQLYHFRNKPSSSRNRDQAGSSSSIRLSLIHISEPTRLLSISY